MQLIIILLIINFFVARLLNRLLVRLSVIYVENSQILSHTIPEAMYNIYLKIYNNPKGLDRLWVPHIPIMNIYHCLVNYSLIINLENKLKQ